MLNIVHFLAHQSICWRNQHFVPVLPASKHSSDSKALIGYHEKQQKQRTQKKESLIHVVLGVISFLNYMIYDRL